MFRGGLFSVWHIEPGPDLIKSINRQLALTFPVSEFAMLGLLLSGRYFAGGSAGSPEPEQPLTGASSTPSVTKNRNSSGFARLEPLPELGMVLFIYCKAVSKEVWASRWSQ